MTAPLTPARSAPSRSHSRGTPHTRVAMFLTGFSTEVHKNLLTYVTGWRATGVQLVMFPAFSLLIALYMGRGQFREDLFVLTVIGFVPYVFAHEQMNRMFWTYLGDIQAGVMEQTYLTPLPSWALILGRQVVAIIAGLPLAIAVYLAGFIAITLHHGRMPFDPRILLPLATIALGSAGYALALSGLTLVFRRIEILPTVVLNVWFIAGGAFVPLDNMPDWVSLPSRLLVPFSPGIEAIHDILLHHRSLATLQSGWGLGWLLAQPMLLLILGTLLFNRLERLALRRGTIGRY